MAGILGDHILQVLSQFSFGGFQRIRCLDRRVEPMLVLQFFIGGGRNVFTKGTKQTRFKDVPDAFLVFGQALAPDSLQGLTQHVIGPSDVKRIGVGIFGRKVSVLFLVQTDIASRAPQLSGRERGILS